MLVTQDKCPITEDVAIVEDQDIATEQTNDTCETDSIVGRHNSIEGMHTDPDQHVKEDGKCNVKENDLMSFASQIANGMVHIIYMHGLLIRYCMHLYIPVFLCIYQSMYLSSHIMYVCTHACVCACVCVRARACVCTRV